MAPFRFGRRRSRNGGESAITTSPESRPQRDGFADFYGYEDDQDENEKELHTSMQAGDRIVFLHETDPLAEEALPNGAHNTATASKALIRDWREATEASLLMVKAAFEDKRSLRSRVTGENAEQLEAELEQLKQQQARLADALFHAEAEGIATAEATAPPAHGNCWQHDERDVRDLEDLDHFLSGFGGLEGALLA
mmetsp:Transcript_145743/g.254298  ORF Transcript_145743/g.254298 Transcript_145743/m.254298 type:complete len:195 (-) Transcript_145743:44-628(-)